MDRNPRKSKELADEMRSLSARRAWIEIKKTLQNYVNYCVALRKESVDRNWATVAAPVATVVALRKESVDRNRKHWTRSRPARVALRKESVDRNAYRNF